MKSFCRLLLIAVFAIAGSESFSQGNSITIMVHVQAPPGGRIAEFPSRPDLVLMTLTNNTQTTQRFRLTGSITGQGNNVSVKMKPSYISEKRGEVVELAPNEIRSYNATNVAPLFDYRHIDIQGIDLENVVYDARLPEGTYLLCLQALDAETNQPISPDGVGCGSFTVNDLEAPIISSPFNNQEIADTGAGQLFNITWMMPPGASLSTVYNVKIVEIQGNMNPNDAIRSTVMPPAFEKPVTGLNVLTYGPNDPMLIPGKRYALAVQATDPLGLSHFRNGGMSEVVTFTYGTPVVIPRSGPGLASTSGESVEQTQLRHVVAINADGIPDCDCKDDIGSNAALKDIIVGNTVIIGGDFRMTISRADKNSADETFNGEGVVSLPVIGNVPGLRLRVAFAGMKVNTADRMIAGVVKGIVSNDAPSFIPRVDTPVTPDFKPSTSDIKAMDDFFKNKTSQLVSNLKSSVNTAGFELPFGIDKAPVTIGIYNITFNAEQAWFSASAAMDIPDGNDRIALQVRAVCMDNEGFCKNGILELAEDFTISGLNLTLLAVTEGNNEQGTYIEFTGNGFEKLFIDSKYTFPAATLISTRTSQPLEVRLTASTTEGWGNWIAEGSLDPFTVNGVADFKFSLADGKKIIYDHADNRNSTGMPTNIDFGTGNTLNFTNDWHGFYFPELIVTLPPAISNATTKQDIVFAAKNLVFDNRGFSGSFGIDNLLALDDGSLDGWYFSVDRIKVNFFKSSMINGGMNGRFMLPVSGEFVKGTDNKQKELDYTCNLSAPEGQSIKYEFTVTLKNNIDFKAWWAHASIGGGSNIAITGGGGESFTATATLNGGLSIVAEIPKLPDIALGHVTFQNMQLSSKTGFTSGTYKVGLGGLPSDQAYNDGSLSGDYLLAENHFSGRGPNADNLYLPETMQPAQSGSDGSQQSLMGFNFSVKSVTPYLADGNIGLTFDTHMQLVNGVDFIPKADLKFSLFANPDSESSGRKVWEAVGGKIEAVKLEVNADLAGLKIDGTIYYFNTENSGLNDRGFGGKLSVVLPVGGTGIAMQGLFGSRSGNGLQPFQFFYIDGVFEMGSSGIPLFPGTQLHGFAGGAYYNMERADTPNPVTNLAANTSMPDENSEQYQNMKSFSGVTYTPRTGTETTLGFMAGIYLGLNSREVLDAELVLSMQFNNGSLNKMALEGRGAFVNKGETFNDRFESAMGKGSIEIAVHFKDGKIGGGFDRFEMNSKVEIKYPVAAPVLTAESNMNFVIQDGEGWYIKIGTPMNRDRVRIGYKNVFSAEAQTYFEAGSFNIDDIPPVPAGILAIMERGNSKSRSEEGSNFQQAAHQIPGEPGKRVSKKGVIFGAALELKADPSFAIFYAHLYAGVGLDLSFKDYETPLCAQGEPGWYVMGQAFMGASAACGVKINVLGIKKNIEFLSAGLAAVVNAGLPNPTYVTGTLAGYFSVLDGLIAKDFRIKFSVGEVCELMTGAEEIKVIEDVYPANNARDVSILARPSVSFNFPINRDFVIPLEYQTADGNFYTKYVLFRLDKQGMQNTTLTGGSQRFTIDNFPTHYRSAYAKKITSMSLLNKAGLLLPETEYTFDVRVKVKKADFDQSLTSLSREQLESLASASGVSFVYVKKEGTNIDYEDTETVKFTTGKGPKNLPVDNVAEVLPYHREQNLPIGALNQANNGMGHLKLILGMTPEFFDSDITNPQPMIRFVTIAGDNVGMQNQNIRITNNGELWQFSMPTLMPNTQYVAKVFFRNPALRQSQDANQISQRMVTRTLDVDGGAVEISGNKLTATEALRMDAGNQELFAWYFKTGSNRDYKSKFNNMKLEKMTIDGIEASIHQSQQVNLSNFDWAPDASTKTISNFMGVSYYYSSSEPFNVMDFEDHQRSAVFPQATTNGLAAHANKINWESMLERSGLDPYLNLIDDAVRDQMMKDFISAAFGEGRNLELSPFTMEWNSIVGGIGRRGHVDYENYTKLMQNQLWDVDYSKNVFGEPSNAGTTQTESTTTTMFSDIKLTAAQTIVTNLTVSPSVYQYFAPANKRYEYIYTNTPHQQSGNGMINAGNGMFVEVIRAAKDLGRPADVYQALPAIGTSLDAAIRTQTQINNTVAPPLGLSGSTFRMR